MKPQHERQIEHVLNKLGLNASEIQVFLTGLRLGPSTIIQLARATELKRITTHAIVARLVKKGLFLETFSKKKRLVYANTLDALQKLLNKKKFEFNELEKEVKSAATLLKSIQSWSKNFPKTRFYKGTEGIHILIQEIIREKQDVYILSDARHFNDLVDNSFLEKSLDTRNKSNLTVKMIFPSGFEYFVYNQGMYEQNLEMRILAEESVFKGGVNIWGDKIAFHCYEGDFITTTIIEDQNIANIMLFMFQNVWNAAVI